MGKIVISAVIAGAMLALPGVAHARADNSKPAEEDRLENRGGGGSISHNRTARQKIDRLDKRKQKRRYILM